MGPRGRTRSPCSAVASGPRNRRRAARPLAWIEACVKSPRRCRRPVSPLGGHSRPAEVMLAKARDILGWDPLELALNGPEEKMAETRYCQPLMLLAGLAALDVLAEHKPEVVERPQATAGLSLGEYTALVAAGVFDFEDGVRLVKLRAEAMQKAAELVPQAMCSVAGLDRAKAAPGGGRAAMGS